MPFTSYDWWTRRPYEDSKTTPLPPENAASQPAEPQSRAQTEIEAAHEEAIQLGIQIEQIEKRNQASQRVINELMLPKFEENRKLKQESREKLLMYGDGMLTRTIELVESGDIKTSYSAEEMRAQLDKMQKLLTSGEGKKGSKKESSKDQQEAEKLFNTLMRWKKSPLVRFGVDKKAFETRLIELLKMEKNGRVRTIHAGEKLVAQFEKVFGYRPTL